MASPDIETITPFVRPPYLSVEAGDPARMAYRRMESESLRSLVVVRGDQYVGIVEWQTIRHLSRDEMAEPVARFVQSDIPTLTPGMTISRAMEAFNMTSVTSVGLLPVVSTGGRLEGVIERDEFKGRMQGASGKVTVYVDPVAHLVSGPDVPRPGAKVISSDGKKLGTFQRHVDDRGRPRWMEVQRGIITKKNRYVPLVAVEHQSRDEVVLNIDRATWWTFSDRPTPLKR
jgi:CBS domain-containing protein